MRAVKQLILTFLTGMLAAACAPMISPTPTSTPKPTLTSTPTWEIRTPSPTATPSFVRLELQWMQSPPEAPLMSISMFNENEGWATRGDGPGEPSRILHTKDGGETWQDRTPQGSGPFYDYRTYFLDPQHAWIVLADEIRRTPPQAIYQTTDGGEHWIRYQDLPFEFPPFIVFADANHGWAMEINDLYPESHHLRIFETKNGGKTWDLVLLNNPYGNISQDELAKGTFHLDAGQHFEFINSNVIWFGGNLKYDKEPVLTFFVSRDASKSWQKIKIEIPFSNEFRFADQFTYGPPTFITEQDAYIIAGFLGSQDNAHTILRTHDGGQTWEVSPTVLTHFGQTYLQFVSPTDAFLDCGDSLCLTHDGARTWQRIQSNLSFVSDGQEPYKLVDNFNFIDTNTGWGTIFQEGEQKLIKTSDGGQTWTIIPITIAP